MAKVKKTPARSTAKKSYSSPFSIYWAKDNYILLFSAIGLLILGYAVMSIGNWDSWVSLNISPIILIIAYVVLLPAAIFYNRRKKKDNPKPTS